MNFLKNAVSLIAVFFIPFVALAATVPQSLGKEVVVSKVQTGIGISLRLPKGWEREETVARQDGAKDVRFSKNDGSNEADITIAYLPSGGKANLDIMRKQGKVVSLGGRSAYLHPETNESGIYMQQFTVPDGNDGFYNIGLHARGDDAKKYKKVLNKSIQTIVFTNTISKAFNLSDNITIEIDAPVGWEQLTSCRTCLTLKKTFKGTKINGSTDIEQMLLQDMSNERIKQYFSKEVLGAITAKNVKMGTMEIGKLNAQYVEYDFNSSKYKVIIFVKDRAVFLVNAQAPLSKWRAAKKEIHKSLETMRVVSS